MAVTLNASTSSGLVQSADTSGVIELQSNGTTALTVNTNEGIQILNCLGVGNATPSTSGAGITFPASQSASTDANTLDDYEEGTWTPTGPTGFPGGGAPSSITATYTKIGKMVSVYATFTCANDATTILLGGLPFTSSSSGSGTVFGFWGSNILKAKVNTSATTVSMVISATFTSTQVTFGAVYEV
jgi:hypothetical protein